jgi:HSP20 family protein
MTMQHWDPLSEVFSLRQAMDRLLEDAVIWPSRAASGARQRGFSVPVNLVEHDNDLVVQAAVPGVRPGDITLQIQDNTLTLEGDVHEDVEQPAGQPGRSNGQQDQQQGRQRYHYQERRYGRFFRQITLPVPVAADQTSALLENGVLTVTMPKAPEARQRRIPIATTSQAPQPAASKAR